MTLVVIYLYIDRSAGNCTIGSLDNITEAIENCVKPILKLKLRNSSFIAIPSQILDECRDITFIDISDVGLTSMDTVSFCKLKKITAIDFSTNSLTALPNQMLADCEPLLIELNFSFNQIEELTDDIFTKVPSLKIIDLSWNRIKKLIDGVFNPLVNLETLRLNNNQISIIDCDLFAHNSLLKTITLNDNTLELVEHDSFRGLKEMRSLELSNNPELKIIDLSGMSRLQRVEIENCSLSMIHIPVHGKTIIATRNDISYIKVHEQNELETLDLSMNHIRNLSDLSPLINLKYLYLSNNELVDIDFSHFAPLKNLIELKIDANPIQRLDSKALCSYVPSVRAIEISADTIDHANLEESSEWFRTHNVRLSLTSNIVTNPDTKLNTYSTTTMRSALNGIPENLDRSNSQIIWTTILFLSLFTIIFVMFVVKQYFRSKLSENICRRNKRHESLESIIDAEETV